MMVASVVILKERMRMTHADWRIADFLNSSLREIFTRLTANTLGVIFGCYAAMV